MLSRLSSLSTLWRYSNMNANAASNAFVCVCLCVCPVRALTFANFDIEISFWYAYILRISKSTSWLIITTAIIIIIISIVVVIVVNIKLSLICVWMQITHWQHPRFHAYFPAGNSYPSILADMLSDAIGCVGFSWVSRLTFVHFFLSIGYYCHH